MRRVRPPLCLPIHRETWAGRFPAAITTSGQGGVRGDEREGSTHFAVAVKEFQKNFTLCTMGVNWSSLTWEGHPSARASPVDWVVFPGRSSVRIQTVGMFA